MSAEVTPIRERTAQRHYFVGHDRRRCGFRQHPDAPPCGKPWAHQIHLPPAPR